MTSHELAHEIGQLCLGGDWACAHGDLSGLRHIAEQLAEVTAEPLHCELVALANACGSDPDRAAALWPRLKDQLFRPAAS